MATGKISVELVLELAKFNAQLKTAVAGMGKATLGGNAVAGIDKASSSMTGLQNATRKVKNEVSDLQKALGSVATQFKTKAQYEAMKPKQSFKIHGVPGGDPIPPADWSQYGASMNPTQGPMGSMLGAGLVTPATTLPQRPKAAAGAVPPVMFPIPKPPVIPPSQSPVGLLGKMIQGGLASPLAIAAQVGAALAGLRVAIGYVKFGFNMIIIPLKILRQSFLEAAESARRLYAKSLQSGGLGTGFVAHRAMLADTIGVSEEEVYSYGRAVRYLNGQLAFASNVAAGTNASLTATAWSLRVVQSDLRALGSLLSYEISDAVRLLARMFHQLAIEIAPLVTIIGKILRTALLTAMTMAAASLGPAMAVAFARIAAKAGFGGDAPTPEVSTKRMPFSAWEKMGLVIGAGSNNNFAQQTAQHTKKTSENTARLIELMTGKNGQLMIPFTLHNAQ